MDGDQPVNFEHIITSVELALTASEDIPEEKIDEILATVEQACVNNERHLMWKSDYQEFVSLLDGVLDGIYGNGYDEQVNQLDDLRAKLEPMKEDVSGQTQSAENSA